MDFGVGLIMLLDPVHVGCEEIDLQLVGGGAVSFRALSAALRLVLGATVGVFVLATEMVSLRLWPGTPSKVP